MKSPSAGNSISGVRVAALLMVMVAASVAIHGYHYGIEDEAIYLPAIKAHLNPALYPHDAIFFAPQSKATLFDELVAGSARLLHAPVDWTVFAFYLGTLLAFYAGLWALAARLFPGVRARLGGMLLIAALLTLPIAGTCIFIVDQHLHPRTLATALILLAAARLAPRAWGEPVALREYALAALWMVGATLIHVQMAFYGLLFLGFLLLPPRALEGRLVLLASFAPPLLLGRLMEKSGPEWQEAARTRTQHYLLQWEWYEWVGAIAPIFVLWGMARLAERRGLPAAAAVARRTAMLAALGFVAGCVITIPPQMERLTVYQPLRILHLTYIVMTLLGGGLLAEMVLKQKAWRWALLLLPIAAAMSVAQFESFPDTHHVEWPGRSTGNAWVEAFDWVKANTPVDAYFVLDPHYMSSEGEDFHGFRGLAERGQMADWDKDPGVALLFPELAARWSHEVHALDNWKNFRAADFRRLHDQFGVGWTVLSDGSPQGSSGEQASGGGQPYAAFAESDCPYRRRGVMVCRIR
jgi:hypothetical protein